MMEPAEPLPMPLALIRAAETCARRLLAGADTAANRLYGWKYNPLYQSGALVIGLYLVLLVTGLWLTLFYRVASPWASVARVTADPWIGNWVRGLHRYASDLAVVATLIHAWRMFGQSRSWGARTLAWASGAVLLFLFLVCGWTGYVMVWDTFGLHLAREGARLFDALPILSEPTSRTFTGEQPVPTVFFFVNLFAHIGVPLAMAVVFWLHVKRLARPTLLPPRAVLWTTVGALAAVAVLRPIGMAPEADPFTLPAVVPTDVFFAFWMPVTRRLNGGWALLAAVTAGAALLAVPLLTARRRRWAPPVSTVDGALCTGCTQCAVDCPFGAITMVDRSAPLPRLAQVDPSLCVSCGICAGSCAPMGVGPLGRTGRDQLAAARAFATSPDRRPGEIVVITCEHAARAGEEMAARRVVYLVSCAGNLHSSVIELLVRSGAGGVLVMACPPRDCWNREGPRWLHERTYRGREAELQPRVDRARVRIAHAGAGEHRRARRMAEAFEADIAALEPVIGARDDSGGEPECTPVEPPRGRRRP